MSQQTIATDVIEDRRGGGAGRCARAHSGVPAAAASQSRPHFEGKDTPKICLEAGLGGPPRAGVSAEEAVAAAARRIRQLGVDHVISGGGAFRGRRPG